jgi:murein lipoprotein
MVQFLAQYAAVNMIRAIAKGTSIRVNFRNQQNTTSGKFMTSTTLFKASLAATCLIAFAGCTDLKPIQAQIDDLKAQVAKLQSDTAKAQSDANAAMAAAQAAASAASGAQSTANQALATGQQNSAAIDEINQKMDRMFKKSVQK